MRTRSPKQLSAVENVKTTINWIETIRNNESKGSSIWVNIAYILHGTIYSTFAYYMRTVQSNFRNLITTYYARFFDEISLCIIEKKRSTVRYTFEGLKIALWIILAVTNRSKVCRTAGRIFDFTNSFKSDSIEKRRIISWYLYF